METDMESRNDVKAHRASAGVAGAVVVMAVCGLMGSAVPVAAQTADGAYVSASLVGELLRRDSVEGGGLAGVDTAGEALGFSLRLGVPVGADWGVEAEFVRSGQIESAFPNGPVPLFLQSSLPVGPFSYRFESAERHTSFLATAWARRHLSTRTSLVFHGGLAINRHWQASDLSFVIAQPAGGRPVSTIFPIPQPTRTESISYSARPVVGVEARVGMTERVALVPSFRVQGMSGGVLMRPSVGLAWTF